MPAVSSCMSPFGAMTRAGVLSASYKFKVLSLDRLGSEFLVMMDLTRVVGDMSPNWVKWKR